MYAHRNRKLVLITGGEHMDLNVAFDYLKKKMLYCGLKRSTFF